MKHFLGLYVIVGLGMGLRRVERDFGVPVSPCDPLDL